MQNVVHVDLSGVDHLSDRLELGIGDRLDQAVLGELDILHGVSLILLLRDQLLSLAATTLTWLDKPPSELGKRRILETGNQSEFVEPTWDFGGL
jgi:hypothetical protein